MQTGPQWYPGKTSWGTGKNQKQKTNSTHLGGGGELACWVMILAGVLCIYCGNNLCHYTPTRWIWSSSWSCFLHGGRYQWGCSQSRETSRGSAVNTEQQLLSTLPTLVNVLCVHTLAVCCFFYIIETWINWTLRSPESFPLVVICL